MYANSLEGSRMRMSVLTLSSMGIIEAQRFSASTVRGSGHVGNPAEIPDMSRTPPPRSRDAVVTCETLRRAITQLSLGKLSITKADCELNTFMQVNHSVTYIGFDDPRPTGPLKDPISAPNASASEDGLSITPGGPPESGASLYSTTQDTGRRLPVVTTASPVNVPNHHPLYSNPPQHRPLFSPHSQPNYFEDSGGSSSHPSSQPTFSTSPNGTPLGNADKRASGESTESSSMQTTLVMHTLAATSHSDTPDPVSSAVLKDLERAAFLPSAVSAAREEDEGRPDQPGLKQDVRPASDEEETTTTTITTTTIITTMQSPIPCQLNMTGPEGYIEAPPQSSSAFHSTMDCSYIITVYMGYGVEVQLQYDIILNSSAVATETCGSFLAPGLRSTAAEYCISSNSHGAQPTLNQANLPFICRKAASASPS
ncbi:Seizure protein 6-like protein [Nibea albiflora]|uniref:Seizure protein 6-like protein n=1 Tax=Nibea albiflora TaxID=240163 RepID=A0ACB7EJT7_NIBAL|nr:Seizure protein 6-like protein [Nibea albiflora]